MLKPHPGVMGNLPGVSTVMRCCVLSIGSGMMRALAPRQCEAWARSCCRCHHCRARTASGRSWSGACRRRCCGRCGRWWRATRASWTSTSSCPPCTSWTASRRQVGAVSAAPLCPGLHALQSDCNSASATASLRSCCMVADQRCVLFPTGDEAAAVAAQQELPAAVCRPGRRCHRL